MLLLGFLLVVVVAADDVNVTITEVPSNSSLEIHGVPGNPTEVIAVAYDGRAQVSWQPPEDDGSDPITQYEVATFFGDENQPTEGNVVIASTDAKIPPQTFTMIGSLKNGASYAFKVRAKNINGESTWSARSASVSPLHPPDLCTHVTCSGHGMCFPNYAADSTDHTVANRKAMCICTSDYKGPDCSTTADPNDHMFDISEWGQCSNGCGGGQRKRTVICMNMKEKMPAIDTFSCGAKEPTVTQICNNMACGSNLVDVSYEIDMNYDEVLFNSQAKEQFEEAFITEVAAAIDTSVSRISVTKIYKGSIWVRFLLLPPTKTGEKTLDELVESLQKQLKDPTSKLRTKGTFARHVNPDSMKLAFFIAEQTTAGQAEDISVAGLIGTVLVLVAFISTFAWYLRRRHERIMAARGHRSDTVIGASRSELKPMGMR